MTALPFTAFTAQVPQMMAVDMDVHGRRAHYKGRISDRDEAIL